MICYAVLSFVLLCYALLGFQMESKWNPSVIDLRLFRAGHHLENIGQRIKLQVMIVNGLERRLGLAQFDPRHVQRRQRFLE